MPCVFSSVFIIVTPTSLSSSEVCDTSVKSQQQLRNNTQQSTDNTASPSAQFFLMFYLREIISPGTESCFSATLRVYTGAARVLGKSLCISRSRCLWCVHSPRQRAGSDQNSMPLLAFWKRSYR